ncbi:MAG: alanine racemase [Ornithinimicrobium sp.]
MAEALFAFGHDRLRTLLRGSSAIQTPCFVYDLDRAADRFRALRRVLPPRVRLAYAVKSNPGAPLLQTFAEQGAWFDCASAGEIAQVLAIGARGQEMVVAGPAKSDQDLRAAVYAGARVQVDGLEDVQRLAQMHHGPPLKVSVRVNPASPITERSTIIGGGGPSAFGVDEEDLSDFVARARAYDGVVITGLQVFAASNELDAAALLANHATALAIGRRLTYEHGICLDLIDIGGGLGIRYAEADPELDIEALGAGLNVLLQANEWFTGDLLLEPGRWLSGPCGVYAARVIRTKVSRGVRFAMLEGGINHLLRPLMTGQSFPTMALSDSDATLSDAGALAAGDGIPDDMTSPFTLAGPLCTSLDRVGTGELPTDLAAGDVVVFGQAGAYAYTQAMTHFLSHPAPEQHWLAGADVVPRPAATAIRA